MRFDQLISIVPLSRIDPDPAELTERLAEATLGGYQALWHPAVLHRSAGAPSWRRAADPPSASTRQLILVPEPCRRFLPSNWEDEARARGARVVAGEETRERLLARVWDELELEHGEDPGSLAERDFFALGLARLWIDMLTAYMKHSSTLDEEHFQSEVLAAAAAAVLGDAAARDSHLNSAFQLIREARERMYPVDVHLLDLCLVHPRAGMDRLEQQLSWKVPVNVLLTAGAAEQLQSRSPGAVELLRAALEGGMVEIIGGDFEESATTLVPLESHLWQLARGARVYRDVLGRTPLVYGRRRFGLAPHLPSLLNRFEMPFVTHFCFDGGVFPVTVDPKFRWEAPDSSTVEALARVPFAADRALEFLRFPSRLARTMAADHVATLPFVHWPMPEIPWYDELLCMARYGAIFGRFTTLSQYFQDTDPPPVSSRFTSDEYASPFLRNAHAQGEKTPISSFAQRHRLRARLESVRWLAAVAQLFQRGASIGSTELDLLESRLELDEPGAIEQLAAAEAQAAQAALKLVRPQGANLQPGILAFNPLSFERQAVIAGTAAPALEHSPGAPPVAGVWSVVDLPAMGFCWIPAAAEVAPAGRTPVQVEGGTIRNEHLEVVLDAATGGIQSIRDRSGRVNRLAQRLVLRGLTRWEEPYDEQGRDGYYAGSGSVPCESQMRANSMEVRSSGPDYAEVVVHGQLAVEPPAAGSTEAAMASFRQVYRLARGQPVLRIGVEILELSDRALEKHADPWESYLACRFAWRDPRMLLLRALGTQAEPSRSRRPETPWFLELHGRRERTAILTGGLPFHQRVGDRMLDMLLCTAGETCRSFEFGVGLDLRNPFHAAQELVAPPVLVAGVAGPPAAGPSGWFFHLDATNVVLTSLAPLGADRRGVRLRVFESAGRHTRARLRCPRAVAAARITDFQGQRTATLDAQGDAVPIDLSPHEITQIEIDFA